MTRTTKSRTCSWSVGPTHRAKTYPLVIPYLDHFREGYLSTGKNVQGLLQEFTRVSERNYFPPQKPKVKKASFQLPDAHAK